VGSPLNHPAHSQQHDPAAIEAGGHAATRVRWRIVGIIMLIMAVTALCRLNLSIAGKAIQDEFGFSTVTMGWFFSAFFVGYAAFQIPWGHAGDRYGPRSVLTVTILWWSLCTAAMGVTPRLATALGWISALGAMSAVRFLTGVGEAAVSPNITRVVAFWTTQRERGLASGLPIAGLGLGGTLTPLLIAWSMVRWGWRVSFYLSAVLGLLVLALFRFYATDKPEEHPGVNAGEAELIRSGREPGMNQRQLARRSAPWRKMLSSQSVWGLILGYGCHGYAFYVYYNWLYIYAVRVRGLAVMRAALWTSAPFVAMFLLSPLGGWSSDRLTVRLGKRRGRRYTVWVGMGVSATLLGIGGNARNASLALALMAVAGGLTMFAGPSFWAACIDLAPDYSASLSALMNTWASLGGWISPIVTAYVAERLGWPRSLDLAALITVAAGLLWFLVDAEKPVT
jgi:MFS transporter, ACS family, glucarate transporter